MVKDIKPQWLNVNITMTAANTYTQVTTPLPINPTLGGGKNKARVIELLKAFVFALPDTLAEDAAIYIQVATKSQASLVAPNNCENFLIQFGRDFQLVTSGAISCDVPMVFDLTDGNGNGMLVATQNIYCAAVTAGQGSALGVGIKFLYRFIDIDMAEYVGIIQSQQ